MAISKVKRERYEKMLEHYNELLDKYLEAQMSLVSGGVKAYVIDDRSLTKFDLDEIDRMIDGLLKKIAELEALLGNKAVRKTVGVIPRDT